MKYNMDSSLQTNLFRKEYKHIGSSTKVSVIDNDTHIVADNTIHLGYTSIKGGRTILYHIYKVGNEYT